jgi:hypothetical protein
LVETLRGCDGKNHTSEIVSDSAQREAVGWITYKKKLLFEIERHDVVEKAYAPRRTTSELSKVAVRGESKGFVDSTRSSHVATVLDVFDCADQTQ